MKVPKTGISNIAFLPTPESKKEPFYGILRSKIHHIKILNKGAIQSDRSKSGWQIAGNLPKIGKYRLYGPKMLF